MLNADRSDPVSVSLRLEIRRRDGCSSRISTRRAGVPGSSWRKQHFVAMRGSTGLRMAAAILPQALLPRAEALPTSGMGVRRVRATHRLLSIRVFRCKTMLTTMASGTGSFSVNCNVPLVPFVGSMAPSVG